MSVHEQSTDTELRNHMGSPQLDCIIRTPLGDFIASGLLRKIHTIAETRLASWCASPPRHKNTKQLRAYLKEPWCQSLRYSTASPDCSFLIFLLIEIIEKQPIMVKTLRFADIEVPTPGFGAMGISFGLGSNLTLEQAEPVLLKAIELGCTFWDTAVCCP